MVCKICTRFISSILFISLGLFSQALWCHCFSQSSPNQVLWDQLINIEKEDSISFEQRLVKVLNLKQQFENKKLNKDSVYARLLHRIAFYEYKINRDVPTNTAINFTKAAIYINSAGKKESSASYLLNSYTNLGIYYRTLKLYDASLKYFDSALAVSQRFPSKQITSVVILLEMSQLLYNLGDYQKAIEKENIAIREAKNTSEEIKIPGLLNQRALAYLKQKRTAEALKDANLASELAAQSGDNWEIATSMMIKAEILSLSKNFSAVVKLYKDVIDLRAKIDDENKNDQIADDYTNLGNFLMNESKNYTGAKRCYFKTLEHAKKANDFERLSKGHVNLGILFFRQHDYEKAEQYYVQALKDLKIITISFLTNPVASQLKSIGNKELVSVIFENKTEFLLQKFKETNNKVFLDACLKTALLTDTLFADIRHQQSGEFSKLYWRNWTRDFFTNAIEACYLANDHRLAFLFMEKSRAVLLADQLNQFSASAHLPKEEAEKEQELKIETISAHEKLAYLEVNTPAYEAQQIIFLQTQNKLDQFVKSLEKKYPIYYQFKYAEKSVTITELQQYLLKHQQNFIHYFMNDTLVYMLGITPGKSQMIRLSKNNFDYNQVTTFNHYCNDKQSLVNNYQSFASLSNTLYQSLFEPLHIPKGKVIICPDNFILPFEALCADPQGTKFLINDYMISYTYSAGYLLNELKTVSANSMFVGFAPVSFQPNTSLPELKQSAAALQKSAGNYQSNKLFIGQQATKNNFIKYMAKYSIINIFSHAFADTNDAEPVLYMQDSMIRLSELQVLNNTSVKLLVLSACQTNAGKSATGEGVYSLARGFASVGIPSVAATLWQADEQSIYEITESFHHYLSQGLSMDSALQTAKLDFIKNNSKSEKSLPFYWANLVIIGNAEAIEFSSSSPWWWITGLTFGVLLIVIIIILLRRKLAF